MTTQRLDWREDVVDNRRDGVCSSSLASYVTGYRPVTDRMYHLPAPGDSFLYNPFSSI